jgi:hypothetical protein
MEIAAGLGAGVGAVVGALLGGYVIRSAGLSNQIIAANGSAEGIKPLGQVRWRECSCNVDSRSERESAKMDETS